jgi:hypothetical protein
MRLTITIELDHDAMQTDQDYEVSRCFEQVRLGLVEQESTGTLRDSNGNTVGRYTVGA